MRHIEEMIEELDKEIAERLKPYPQQLKLACTVPGIKPTQGARATTIALAYKDRWEIENFFKILKQNLKIKSSLSTSPNAVWTQIWAAVIAMLVVRYLQMKSSG
jgi:hypothetical protein